MDNLLLDISAWDTALEENKPTSKYDDVVKSAPKLATMVNRGGDTRYNLSDDTASIVKDPKVYTQGDDLTHRLGGKIGMTGTGDYLPDVLQHDKLYKLYPELSKVRVIPKEDMPEGVTGAYDESSKILYIKPGLPMVERRKTIMHELQHSVQGIDGVDSGTSIQKEAKTLGQLLSEYNVTDSVDSTTFFSQVKSQYNSNQGEMEAKGNE